jgi:hypothetical protein
LGKDAVQRGCISKFGRERASYLLHDSSLALGESDVSTRLILNELDFNLSSLATGFVIVVVVIVESTLARTLDTAIFGA